MLVVVVEVVEAALVGLSLPEVVVPVVVLVLVVEVVVVVPVVVLLPPPLPLEEHRVVPKLSLFMASLLQTDH